MQIKNGHHEITEVSMYASIIKIETRLFHQTTCLRYQEGQYLRRRLDFLLPGNSMASFLAFLALEIRILREILHEMKHDYAECYLLSLKKHTQKHEAVAMVYMV